MHMHRMWTSPSLGLLICLPIGGLTLTYPSPSLHHNINDVTNNNIGRTIILTSSTTTTTTELSMRRRRRRRRRRSGTIVTISEDDDPDDCIFRDRDEHIGLAKSVDEEYLAEEAKLGLSFWEVLER